VVVPYRTLHRFCVAEFGFGKQRLTVRVMDGEPGSELQVDFGSMGLLHDVTTGRRRVCWALIFTACYSRHMLVWLSFRQTVEDVIEGFEQAWEFFGGVFKVVIPDNLKAVVDVADDVDPRFDTAFQEYAQSRGFVIDPARVGTPTDKPRVERVVPYVREAGFRGEKFNGLEDAQAHMVRWCLKEAGERIHGTTQRRPVEVFRLEELPRLLAAPTSIYDLPIYAQPKVHRDRHVEVAKALYSIPEGENLVGLSIHARLDRQLAKFFYKGRLVKVHPRQAPGGRSTDPADLPDGKRGYAMRDLEYLKPDGLIGTAGWCRQQTIGLLAATSARVGLGQTGRLMQAIPGECSCSQSGTTRRRPRHKSPESAQVAIPRRPLGCRTGSALYRLW
jgi:hypothetical protein